MDIIEDRCIYEIDGKFWMVLTLEELLQWRREAPSLVRYINGEPCLKNWNAGIQGALMTPDHSKPALCLSCRWATVTKGTTLDQELIYCAEIGGQEGRIRFKVTECSKYDNKASASLSQMKLIAWELRTDKKGNRIGFMSPIEAKVRQDELLPLRYRPDFED